MTDLIAGIECTSDTIQHIQLCLIVFLVIIAALFLGSIAACI